MMRFLPALLCGAVSIACFVAGIRELNLGFSIFGVGFGVAAVCQGINRMFRLDEYRQRLDRFVNVAGWIVGIGIVVAYFILQVKPSFEGMVIKE